MINALLLCMALMKDGRKTDEIFPEFTFDPCVFVSVPVTDRAAVAVIAASDAVKNAVKQAEDIMNGCGRVVLHPSGTEPKIRVWVSGSDESKVRAAADLIINEVKKSREV